MQDGSGDIIKRLFPPVVTESDWHEADNPMKMIRFLGASASNRKQNLLIAACFRRIWHLLKTARGHRAIEVLEQFVEGNATAEQWAQAKEDAWQSTKEIPNPEDSSNPEHLAIGAIGLHNSIGDHLLGVAYATAWVKVGTPAAISEPEAQCVLVREIFGNPFRPIPIDIAWLAWNDGTISKVAQPIYDERAFDRMPILADALEDAGCDNADILTHCRNSGDHVRGCWVVDLLLGKS